MAYWSDHSLLVAMQSAFGTANTTDGDFDAIKCELPAVSFETEVVELDLLTGQPGAEPERMPGARGGTISFTIPLEGFKTGYDPTSDDPGDAGVIPLWLSMLANAMGSNLSAVSSDANFKAGLMCSVSQYTSAGVASATSTAITMDNATASDKVDGLGLGLPMLDVGAVHLLRARAKGSEHGGVEGVREHYRAGHVDSLAGRFTAARQTVGLALAAQETARGSAEAASKCRSCATQLAMVTVKREKQTPTIRQMLRQ